MLFRLKNASAARLRGFHTSLLVDPERSTLALREGVVLLTSAVLLVVYFYFGKASYFRAELMPSMREAGLLDSVPDGWLGILPWTYWAAAGLFIRVFVPLVVILVVLREHPRAFGFGWRGAWRHAWIYVVLFLVMLPVLVIASTSPSFQTKYPFYEQAGQGLAHFVAYEVAYGVQFLSLEAFFRGFLLFGLYRKFGYYALAVMAVPYCLVHFGKPMPETLGAIGAGLILGYLALKCRSIYPGAALHWAIGLCMDLLALAHKPHNVW